MVDIEFFPILTRQTEFSGVQSVYKFDNGYGASVIKSRYSYGGQSGLWKLAVLEFSTNEEWHLTYNTPITADVRGYLTQQEVNDLLVEISELPSREVM